MTLRAGDELPLLEFVAADGSVWTPDGHRRRDASLLLILHRHLA